MNNLQRFLQGCVVVRLRNENQVLKLRRVLEALQVEYINAIEYSLQNIQDILMNEINRDYPLTNDACLCYEYQPGKGITCQWEYKAKKGVEDGYYDEIIDFDALELDKIIKNFKNI